MKNRFLIFSFLCFGFFIALICFNLTSSPHQVTPPFIADVINMAIRWLPVLGIITAYFSKKGKVRVLAVLLNMTSLCWIVYQSFILR